MSITYSELPIQYNQRACHFNRQLIKHPLLDKFKCKICRKVLNLTLAQMFEFIPVEVASTIKKLKAPKSEPQKCDAQVTPPTIH